MPSANRVDCAWCGASLRDGKRLGGGLLCRSCGVTTTDPWPTEAELDDAYASWYRPADGRFSGLGDRLLRLTRSRLANRIDRIAPAGPVLDVGAGDGTLLAALKARDREAVGLERQDGGQEMRAGGLAHEQDGDWAAIVFWHSLEHLPEPGLAIDQAATALRSGGVVVIAVPNAASMQARAFGERWFAIDAPRHLVHLTAAALLARLVAAGMRVERVSYLRGGQVLFGWLDGIVGLIPGRPSLYDAIRRPQARSAPMSARTRWGTLAVAVMVLPLAAAAALIEVVARRGGTVYMEARLA
jgi:SAM-dependent methyltransferase